MTGDMGDPDLRAVIAHGSSKVNGDPSRCVTPLSKSVAVVPRSFSREVSSISSAARLQSTMMPLASRKIIPVLMLLRKSAVTVSFCAVFRLTLLIRNSDTHGSDRGNATHYFLLVLVVSSLMVIVNNSINGSFPGVVHSLGMSR